MAPGEEGKSEATERDQSFGGQKNAPLGGGTDDSQLEKLRELLMWTKDE